MRAVHMLWVAGVWRDISDLDRADGLVQRLRLLLRVVAHGGVVRVLVAVDVGDRQAEARP